MAIRVECKNCRAAFSAKDEHAGRSGKCPSCGKEIKVPAKPVADQVPSAPVTTARVAPQLVNRKSIETTTVARRPTNNSKSHDSTNVAARAAVVPAPARPNTARPAAGNIQPSEQAGIAIAAPRDRAIVQKELLAKFRGAIEPVAAPLGYRLGIALSSIVMVLLPVVYLAIIGLTIWAVQYHARYDTSVLEMGTGRARLFMVLVYAAPIVVGVIMIFFMLKPLFARPLMMGRTRSLTRQGEPRLFAFVDRVCEAVGSRPPTRINVDWELNASASLSDGWFRLFRSGLILTVGAPLVAGLDIGQFAGVLAHEFGHFTQASGRRLTFLVRSIDLWFMRVVYQRDAWDAQLEAAAIQWDIRIGWVLHLARLGVWLSRRILWGLMMLGHVVSSFLLRQMEFHADAHETRLVGGDVFESTTRKIALLQVAYQGVVNDLRSLIARGKLPDDLSHLILEKSNELPHKALKAIAKQVDTAKTGWLDTHPSPAERIRHAHAEQARGVFTDARPAAAIFTDFKSLSRNTTFDLYRACFGTRFQPSMMHPVEELATAAKAKINDDLPAIKLE